MKNVYEEITRNIVAAIERGNVGQWRIPWHCTGESLLPINAITKRPYRGVNVLALWAAAEVAGHSRSEWGTYAQWRSVGAQVRKGERSTLVVFWKFCEIESDRDEGETDDEPSRTVLARGYSVFNADQVDNALAPVEPETTENERIEIADLFFEGIGANVKHGGNRAYYSAAHDRIQMPPYASFDEPAGYYSTLAHEYTHWTAPKARCNRELGKRFGDAAYAAEELIAELGAAFICAHLGLSSAPREDHAEYILAWLNVLKADSRAIFALASKAQQAADYLTQRARAEDDDSSERLQRVSRQPILT